MSSSESERNYSIVVGIDYSEASALALTEAARIAKTHAPSQVHVAHVAPSAPPMQNLGFADPSMGGATPIPAAVPDLSREMSENLQAYVTKTLSGMASELDQASVRWATHVLHATPAQALAQLASDLGADLAVVGTHGRRGVARFLLGSVAESVVRLAPCPVLVVRPVGGQAGVDGPLLEPPCPDCLAARRESGGQELWCARHREHHGHAHTYHFSPFRDSHSSGLLIYPT